MNNEELAQKIVYTVFTMNATGNNSSEMGNAVKNILDENDNEQKKIEQRQNMRNNFENELSSARDDCRPNFDYLFSCLYEMIKELQDSNDTNP